MRAHRFFLFLVLTILFFLPACAAPSLAPEVSDHGARFLFLAPRATTVSIAGSFNHWDMETDRLAGPDRRGIWTILLQLPPGRYEYRYIVDGKDWVLDPGAPSVDDGLGGSNSVIMVPTE